ncbi:hypothetical protein OAV27_03655, partial [Euryarchaeota archaeon]|nr:hypothetical protein [Euryarchaeota archaeon]
MATLNLVEMASPFQLVVSPFMSNQIPSNFPHSLLASVVTCELSGMGSTEERLDDLRKRKAIA